MKSEFCGIDVVNRYINNNLDETKHRRIKIVHVDADWLDGHVAISGVGRYLYELPSHRRWTKNSRTGVASGWHGVSCTGILKCNIPEEVGAGFFSYWNLASQADIFLAGVPNLAERDDIEGISYDEFSYLSPIAFALEKVVEAAGAGNLGRGDIVTLPLGIDISKLTKDAKVNGEQFVDGKWCINDCKYPLIHDIRLEAAITKLTCDHGITVVAAAGNNNTNLSCDTDTGDDHRKMLYQNNGTPSGAILVGSLESNASTNHSNKGTCVDAYGPSDAHEFSQLNVVPYNEMMKPDEFPLLWYGSSSATMFVAAALFQIQQFREIQGLKPYKPFELRAHLRQWTSPLIVDGVELFNYVDLVAWIIGTGMDFEDKCWRKKVLTEQPYREN